MFFLNKFDYTKGNQIQKKLDYSPRFEIFIAFNFFFISRTVSHYQQLNRRDKNAIWRLIFQIMRIVMVWWTWSCLAILFSPTFKSTRNCDVKWRRLLESYPATCGEPHMCIVLPLRFSFSFFRIEPSYQEDSLSIVACKRVHGRHFTTWLCLHTLNLKMLWATSLLKSNRIDTPKLELILLLPHAVM